MHLSLYAHPDHPRPAVGALVFHHKRVLLVRRAHPPSRGQWAVPGGRIRLGETLQQAAEREILEETGILIKAAQPILTFDLIERDADGRIVFHYIIVDLAADYIDGRIQAGDDALEARWIAAGELEALDVNPRTLDLLARFPGFEFSDGARLELLL